MTNPEGITQWIEKNFSGHGRALRTLRDPPIDGEPFMSMVDAKELVRDAVKAFGGVAQAKPEPPGHEDLMVTPESLDAWLKDNPLPPPAPQPSTPAALLTQELMNRTTVSSSGKEITIACNDHDTKDAIMNILIDTAYAGPVGIAYSPLTWQPIETAPKDGTEVLILTNVGVTQARFAPGEWHDYPEGREYDGPVWVCCDDQWQIEIEDCGKDGMHHGSATHWMPRPATPSLSSTPLCTPAEGK